MQSRYFWPTAIALIIGTWFPVALYSQAPCVSNNQSTAIRQRISSGTIKTNSAGKHVIKYHFDGVNSQMASIYVDALSAIQGEALNVVFEPTSNPSEADYQVFLNSSMSYTTTDPCAYTTWTPSTPGAPAETQISSHLNSAASSATGSNRQSLVGLATHETLHILGLGDAGQSASGTMMKNYNPNSNDCQALANSVGYPSSIPSADVTKGKDCLYGQEPTESYGGDDQDFEAPLYGQGGAGGGGGCLWAVYYTIWSTSWDPDTATLTSTVIGSGVLYIVGDCPGEYLLYD